VKELEQFRPMTPRVWFLARLAYVVVRFVCVTLRLRIEREEEVERLIREHKGAIVVTWHGRTLMAVNRWRGKGYHALISMSRDGDFLSEVFRLFGFKVIRGSTGRRAVLATREALTALENGGVLVMTPDGPRGPTHVVQSGVVYFAQRSGKPIIMGGLAAYPRKLMRSWDSYMVPLPFARARWIYGAPIFVGKDEDVDDACRRVAAAITALERQAEDALGIPESERVPEPEPPKSDAQPLEATGV
jgi:lysophospholipid acyltransferase (LPLAT)-like uncharacterized protein